MHGTIAAAQAFLKAGNLKLALEHAETALKENPHAPAALDIYSSILVKLGQFDKLEATAMDWIGRYPQDSRPYMLLIGSYGKRKEKKLASAVVEHFRAANPENPRLADVLKAAYETLFGNIQRGYAGLARQAGLEGDKVSEFQFGSIAAQKRGNLSEAITQAEFARRSGDDSANTAARLSMLCFRTLRLGKCRHYARIALAANRDLPRPRELLVLSWLVLLPPFLLAHVGLWAMSAINNWHKHAWLIVLPILIFGMPFVMAVFWLASLLMTPLYLNGLPTYALFFAFVLYSPFIGSISKIVMGQRKKELKLSDY